MLIKSRTPAILAILVITSVACGDSTGEDQRDGRAPDAQTPDAQVPDAGTCGNGALDPGEACDGTDFGADSCVSRGFTGGALACTDGCSVIDPSGCTGGGGVPLADFSATLADAVCGALFRCCDASDLDAYFAGYAGDSAIVDAGLDQEIPPVTPLTTEAECRTALDALVRVSPFGDWIAQAELGNVTYDGEATAACVAELDDAACGAPLREAIFDSACFAHAAPSSPERRAMFVRTRGVGDACVPLWDGVGSRFYGTCDPTTSFCCYQNAGAVCAYPFDGDGVPRSGTCQEASTAGEVCDAGLTTVQMCVTGQECGFATSTCVAMSETPIATGQPCYDDAEWVVTGDCADGWCDAGGSNVCEPFRSNGEACFFGFECTSGWCEAEQCAENETCAGP